MQALPFWQSGGCNKLLELGGVPWFLDGIDDDYIYGRSEANNSYRIRKYSRSLLELQSPIPRDYSLHQLNSPTSIMSYPYASTDIFMPRFVSPDNTITLDRYPSDFYCSKPQSFFEDMPNEANNGNPVSSLLTVVSPAAQNPMNGYMYALKENDYSDTDIYFRSLNDDSNSYLGTMEIKFPGGVRYNPGTTYMVTNAEVPLTYIVCLYYKDDDRGGNEKRLVVYQVITSPVTLKPTGFAELFNEYSNTSASLYGAAMIGGALHIFYSDNSGMKVYNYGSPSIPNPPGLIRSVIGDGTTIYGISGGSAGLYRFSHSLGWKTLY